MKKLILSFTIIFNLAFICDVNATDNINATNNNKNTKIKRRLF